MVEIATNGVLNAKDFSEVGITDGLVAWYPLDGNARDYTMNRNDGTVNGASVAEGLGQGCYSFDGVANYINILGGSTIEPENLTVSAWINMNTSASTGRNIFCTKWNGYSFEIEATTRIPYFRLTGPGDCRSSSALILGSWQLLVGTFEKGVGSKIYLDGVLKGTTNTSIGITYTQNSVLNIGRYAGGVYFNGLIQDVRIYNRALTPEEIKILYDLTKNKKTSFTSDGKVFIPGQLKEVY